MDVCGFWRTGRRSYRRWQQRSNFRYFNRPGSHAIFPLCGRRQREWRVSRDRWWFWSRRNSRSYRPCCDKRSSMLAASRAIFDCERNRRSRRRRAFWRGRFNRDSMGCLPLITGSGRRGKHWNELCRRRTNRWGACRSWVTGVFPNHGWDFSPRRSGWRRFWESRHLDD